MKSIVCNVKMSLAKMPCCLKRRGKWRSKRPVASAEREEAWPVCPENLSAGREAVEKKSLSRLWEAWRAMATIVAGQKKKISTRYGAIKDGCLDLS